LQELLVLVSVMASERGRGSSERAEWERERGNAWVWTTCLRLRCRVEFVGGEQQRGAGQRPVHHGARVTKRQRRHGALHHLA
jgi:hypothetical protein